MAISEEEQLANYFYEIFVLFSCCGHGLEERVSVLINDSNCHYKSDLLLNFTVF